jgi:hypothetical protein
LSELEAFIRTYSFPILIGVVSAVILGATIGIVAAIRQRVVARRQQEAFLRVREVATIVEKVRMTGAGSICWFLLGTSALFWCVAYYSAETVAQQVGLGVLLAVSLSIFGLGAALGRRRTYTVYQHRIRARSTDQSHEPTSEMPREAELGPSDYPTRHE